MMLVGHNPTFEELTSLLVGAARVRMPTASVACIGLPFDDWKRISPGCGILEWLIVPKLLKGVWGN